MSRLDDVFASPDWVQPLATELARRLGDDRTVTVGDAPEDPAAPLSAEPSRSVALHFSTDDGERAAITLHLLTPVADALERAASDEILVTSVAAALDGAAHAIGEQADADIETKTPYEPNDDSAADDLDAGALVAYPLLDGSDLIGWVTVRIGTGSGPTATDGYDDGADAERNLAEGALPGASFVLADVEMGVTAELGRCRMTVRELLSITPGAVIDLDRAAGTPVDVLVNGTLIARGEVVVIDEEFGIRISELVPQPAGAR